LVLMPDGRTLAASYDSTSMANPRTCMSTQTNASTANAWYIACHQ
jgi:hypothetical protein